MLEKRAYDCKCTYICTGRFQSFSPLFVYAMTKAASVQSLPPLDRFTGEGSQADDDSIDRWLERFDERAHLAEWSDEVKLYKGARRNFRIGRHKTDCARIFLRSHLFYC